MIINPIDPLCWKKEPIQQEDREGLFHYDHLYGVLYLFYPPKNKHIIFVFFFHFLNSRCWYKNRFYIFDVHIHFSHSISLVLDVNDVKKKNNLVGWRCKPFHLNQNMYEIYANEIEPSEWSILNIKKNIGLLGQNVLKKCKMPYNFHSFLSLWNRRYKIIN